MRTPRVASIQLRQIKNLGTLEPILAGLAESIANEPEAANIQDTFGAGYGRFLEQISTTPQDAFRTVQSEISPLIREIEDRTWRCIMSRYVTLEQYRLQLPDQALCPRADCQQLEIDCEDDALREQVTPLLSWFQELVIDGSVWRGGSWPFVLGQVVLDNNLVEAQTLRFQVNALPPDSTVGLKVARLTDHEADAEIPRFTIDLRKDLLISAEILSTLLFNCHLPRHRNTMELSADFLLQPASKRGKIDGRYYTSALKGHKTTNKHCDPARTFLSRIQKALLANQGEEHLLPRLEAMNLDSELHEEAVALIKHVPLRIGLNEEYFKREMQLISKAHLSLRRTHTGDMSNTPTLFIDLEVSKRAFPRSEDALWDLIAKTLVKWLEQDSAKRINLRSLPKTSKHNNVRFVVSRALNRQLALYPTHHKARFQGLIDWLAQMRHPERLPRSLERIACAVGDDKAFSGLVKIAKKLLPYFVRQISWIKPTRKYPTNHIILRNDPDTRESWQVMISATLPDFLSRDPLEWMELVTLVLRYMNESRHAVQILTEPRLFPLDQLQKTISSKVYIEGHRSLWYKLGLFWEYEQLLIADASTTTPPGSVDLRVKGGVRAKRIFEQLTPNVLRYQRQYPQRLMESLRERPFWILSYFKDSLESVRQMAVIITLPGARIVYFNQEPDLSDKEWQQLTERIIAAPLGINRFFPHYPDLDDDLLMPKLWTEDDVPRQDAYDANPTYKQALFSEREAYQLALQLVALGAQVFGLKAPSPTMSYRDIRELRQQLLLKLHPDHKSKDRETDSHRRMRERFSDFVKALDQLEPFHRDL